MHLFNSFDDAVAKVNDALVANAYPTDANGTRKLLVTLRALRLVDWIEPKADAPAKPSA
jgi:hypothetical protein